MHNCKHATYVTSASRLVRAGLTHKCRAPPPSLPPPSLTPSFRPYLDVPLSVTQGRQAQLISHLGGVHGLGQILLVGEDQEDGVPELVFVQHPVQFVAR